MTIKLLLTGGTIDKTYNELNGNLEFPETNFNQIISQSRITQLINIEEIMLKDSLDMTDIDRNKILKYCEKTSENKIIISHGTDTMVDTAKVLGENIKNKTIILFGAMIPYTISESDALFNFGCAISAVQTLKTGIYITMNGKIFPYNNVNKNKSLGEFQEIN